VWRPKPVEGAEIEAHTLRHRREVEAHGISFRRMTLTPADDAEAVVLEPIGPGPAGELVYRMVSGPADVEGHLYRH
jgi:hypothetical protein